MEAALHWAWTVPNFSLKEKKGREIRLNILKENHSLECGTLPRRTQVLPHKSSTDYSVNHVGHER